MPDLYSFDKDEPNPIWDTHIDIIMKVLYNDRNYIIKTIESILLENGISLNESEIKILKWHLMLSRCVSVVKPKYIPQEPDNPYEINEQGIQVMIGYGDYVTYINKKRREDKKEERRKNFSQQLKNTQIIFGIMGGVIATSILITQSLSKSDIGEQKKRIEYLQVRVDSLQGTLQQLKPK